MEKALDVLDSIIREIITKRFGIGRDASGDSSLAQPTSPQNLCSGSQSPQDGEEGLLHQKNSCREATANTAGSKKSGAKKSGVPSYEELALDLTLNGNPKEILRYATKHENNRLILDEQDIQELEQEALRELARGNRIRYAPRK